MVIDIGNLMQALGPISGSGQPVMIGAPKQISTIKLVAVHPPPVYASNALAAGTIVAIVPLAIVSANGTPVISASLETTVHMANPATDLVSSPGAVAAPQRSMFQTDNLALRFTMDTTWTTRGAGVAWIEGANWP